MSALASVILLARAGDAPEGCARLCGNWALDTALSESAEPVVDAALRTFKEPKQRKAQRPRTRPDDMWGPDEPDAPAPARPTQKPAKAALRSQLLTELAPPDSLAMGDQADVILIRTGGGEERRLYPGEPHSRVDARGTTKISTEWKKDALVVKESQGRKRGLTETFELQADGNLQLTRVLERPGLKELRLRAIYRRGQTQALESGAPGRPQNSAP
jgi:hypothetical protein